MLKFQRLNKISDNGETILKALKQSTDNLLEVDIENKKIRRNPEVPLPEKVNKINDWSVELPGLIRKKKKSKMIISIFSLIFHGKWKYIL